MIQNLETLKIQIYNYSLIKNIGFYVFGLGYVVYLCYVFFENFYGKKYRKIKCN